MKIKFIAFLMCLTALFSACHDDEPESPKPEPAPAMADRTVLVYIAGDNSLTDDDDLAQLDSLEMVEGIANVDTKRNNLLLYIDKRKGEPKLIRLCRNTNNEIVQDIVQIYPTRNSAGVSEMKEVMNKAFADFPANSYGVSLWSHAEGWLKAEKTYNPSLVRSFGDDNGYNMDISELHDVLMSIPHLDFVLFDACFMQSAEVLYELRDRASYFIGAPCEIPGPGAPYDKVVPALFKSGAIEDVAKNIAQQYHDPYVAKYDENRYPTNTNWTGGVAIGVLKSSELDALAAATQQILNKYIVPTVVLDVSSLLYYGRRGRQYYYTDIDAFMRMTALDATDYEQWKQAFDRSMILFLTTPKIYSSSGGLFSMQGASGLSIYIPCGNDYYYAPKNNRTVLNAFYQTYQWYNTVGWAAKGW